MVPTELSRCIPSKHEKSKSAATLYDKALSHSIIFRAAEMSTKNSSLWTPVVFLGTLLEDKLPERIKVWERFYKLNKE